MATTRPWLSTREIDISRMPGHWLLARLGKQVLRPGGLELTHRMLEGLAIGPADEVVEFAPGLGLTAREVLRRHPRRYTAVERDAEAAQLLRRRLGADCCVAASVEQAVLPSQCATVVYGEALLSMQTPEQKARIVGEAFRLLKPGGRYGIHELCAEPEDLPEKALREMERRMSLSIHVGVRLLTVRGWRRLFQEAGLAVTYEVAAAMRLLEPARVLRDEGLPRAARIAWNLLRDRRARARVEEMRRLFRDYGAHLRAIVLVGRKPPGATASRQP